MTRITMKSGNTIEIDEAFVKQYMSGAIEEYVEDNHSHCSCSLNESVNHCECDGNLTDKNFEIENIKI